MFVVTAVDWYNIFMDIVLYNVVWMTVNIFLAFVALVSGFALLKFKSLTLKILFLLIWITFIPNTIYIVTDIAHLFDQFNKVSFIAKPVLFLEYFILEAAGIISFVASVHVFEKLLYLSPVKKKKILVTFLIILLNFLIGFGVVLGRIERTNSWEIFIDPVKVINDSRNVLSSFVLMLMSLFYGEVGVVVYFFSREKIMSFVRILLEKLKIA